MARRLFPLTSMLVAFAIGAIASAAMAQETRTHQHRKVRQAAVLATAGAPVTFRGLTINRPPEAPPQSDDDDGDIYRDGPIRYNDVRDFSPSPYTTSGVQFPFGLDGVGGYGSDLDIGAGQDAALYDRGAGLR